MSLGKCLSAIAVLGMFVVFAGCEEHWKTLRAGFVEGPAKFRPADDVEKTIQRYIAYRVELHEQEILNKPLFEKLKKIPQPWRWPELPGDIVELPGDLVQLPGELIELPADLLATPDRWAFESPAEKDLFEGVIYRSRGVKREVVSSLDAGGMVRLADVTLRERWLDFARGRVENYKYGDVKSAAQDIRRALLRDIFSSSAPADVGEPMLPALMRAIRVPGLSRYVVQNLQIITGRQFGYPAESLLDPGSLLLKFKQKRAIGYWEAWWLTYPKRAELEGAVRTRPAKP